jgi:murein DD-endopeptidase MepM/ murein hydrolase activator NlpD
MSKEFFDWETIAGPGGGMDMLSNSVRKGIEFDSYAGVTTFRARVLTDAYPLNKAQAALFNSSDQVALQSGMPDNDGDNFTGDNVEVAKAGASAVGRFFMRVASLGQPDALAAGRAVTSGVAGFGGRVWDLVTGRGPFDEDAANASGGEDAPFFGFIFKARILGPNSPHAFIPDPCDDAFLECPEKALPYVMMHTSFITTGENQEGGSPSKGDIVVVQLTQNEFSFNLQFGEFVKRESTNVQNINERQLQQKEAQCQSLSNLFGAGTPSSVGQNAAPGTAGHGAPTTGGSPTFDPVIPANVVAQWPTTGTVTSRFQLSRPPIAGVTTQSRAHPGVDIGVPLGTNVYPAIGSGEVVAINQPSIDGTPCRNGAGYCNPSGGGRGFGNWVRIKHTINGRILHTQYMHLQIVSVNVGDTVEMNTKIAETGHTGLGSGPHLHWELWDGAWAPRRFNPSRPAANHIDPVQGLRLQQSIASTRSVAPTNIA